MSHRERARKATAFGLALVLIALTSSGCPPALLAGIAGQFKPPELTVRSVNITGVSVASVSFEFVCDARNPNRFEIDLARFAYQLTVDGHRLAEGRSDQRFQVAAGATATLRLP